MIDPSLPWLEEALDVKIAEHCLRAADILPRNQVVSAARLSRHRTGRRCLIEYDLSTQDGKFIGTLIGKSRAKGLDRRSVRNLRHLRTQDFGGDAPDGICVSDVLGVIEPWRMWLSTRVNWKSYSDFANRDQRVENARRAARCARKLHCARLQHLKVHSIDDELSVLDGSLDEAASVRPVLREQIRYVKELARSVGGSINESGPAVIHRDFYPDQLLFDENRSMILDLDLLSIGDPRLDIGNFIAHLTEHAVREHKDAHALDDEREALVNEYTASEDNRHAILAYEALSLARHVWISIRIDSRNSSTTLILDESRQRLESMAQTARIAS